MASTTMFNEWKNDDDDHRRRSHHHHRRHHKTFLPEKKRMITINIMLMSMYAFKANGGWLQRICGNQKKQKKKMIVRGGRIFFSRFIHADVAAYNSKMILYHLIQTDKTGVCVCVCKYGPSLVVVVGKKNQLLFGHMK